MALVKYNNNSLSAITSTGLTAGAMTLIKSQTASSSATISFVHGTSDVVLDSTYPIYLFKFYDIHPATNGEDFVVNFRDGGSAYDATKTTTYFTASHAENDSEAQVVYDTGRDIAQGTGFQDISNEVGNENHECGAGELWLFSPSSTTYVKHFICTTSFHHASDLAINTYIAGYCNVTAAIDAVQFKMSSGNLDAGTIKLYGIKDS